ncbi:putative siderophore-dependent iron transporter [Pseudovirgaria hyperparasitica]|uniref:Putative siderophore-dependent iron transporter n=1 Tax=Pseudovirgaria hyperparasitica TaxID=470096 RepID=A0A6A6WB52_9PEZI|nr:putative siderophore-dependent iron transporter [Pseudovirgaria hyperparasitica]KAF2760072.1 putative siderophore-dependent iron transporter [Pseudovirgaria hyperparasitica]
MAEEKGTAMPVNNGRGELKDDHGIAIQEHGALDTNPHADSQRPTDPKDVKHRGVEKMERFNDVLYHSGRTGKVLLWVLAVSMIPVHGLHPDTGLICYQASLLATMIGYSLDQASTSQFTVIAASSFGRHADIVSYGAIATASQIIRAIAEPFLGRMSDITSRPDTYIVVLVFYAIGYSVAASCNNTATYAIGICFTSFGESGLDLLSNVIVGDLTPLQWRAFAGGMLNVSSLFTTFAAGGMVDALVPDKWRWGLGIFAIMIPILMLPAIGTLYGIQRKADKMSLDGIADSSMVRKNRVDHSLKRYIGLARQGIIDIDLLGLVLLGFAFSLILLCLTLAENADGGWSNRSMIAMLVVGFVLLGAFIAYEVCLAPKPVMRKTILLNKAWICATVVTVASQMSTGTRAGYFSSYTYVTQSFSDFEWSVFNNVSMLTLYFTSPLGGLIHRITHRYKTLMLIGAVLRLIGNGIVLTGNGRATQSLAALAVSQVLVGFRGFMTIGAKVGSQGSVAHTDLASAVSLLFLWGILASSVGSAIGALIWTNKMPKFLREELPAGTSEATIKKVYGSIKLLKEYDLDDPIRVGAVRAYDRTMGIIFLTSLLLSTVCVVFTLAMPDYYLGKQQNAIDNKGVDGHEVVGIEDHTNRERYTGPGLWNRIRRAYYKDT